MRILLLTTFYPLLALSSFLDPLYGVLGYVFISVIRPEQLNSGSPPFRGIFALFIVCLLLSCIIRRERLLESLKTDFFRYCAWFVAAIYLSTLASSYTDFQEARGSIYYLNFFPQIAVFCLCFYTILDRVGQRLVQSYLKFVLLFFCLMGLWGIAQYFRGNLLVENLFGHCIIDRCAITAVFILYLPLTVFFLKSGKRLEVMLGAFCFAVFLTMIILTQSRAGFLGVCTSLLGVFWYSRRKVRFAVSAAVLVLAALPLIPTAYFERISAIRGQDIAGDEITDYSSASRLLLWEVGLDLFADHPLLGIGNLNFSKASAGVSGDFDGVVDKRLHQATFGAGGKGGLSHTHNTFLNILVEGGVASATPYFAVLFIPLWRGHRLHRKKRGTTSTRQDLINLLNCGIAGYLAAAFFTNLAFIDFVYWNLTLSYYLSRKEGKEPDYGSEQAETAPSPSHDAASASAYRIGTPC